MCSYVLSASGSGFSVGLLSECLSFHPSGDRPWLLAGMLLVDALLLPPQNSIVVDTSALLH